MGPGFAEGFQRETVMTRENHSRPVWTLMIKLVELSQTVSSLVLNRDGLCVNRLVVTLMATYNWNSGILVLPPEV